jgi:CPA2 family monovalent cation:H+ antiporter-2
MMQRWLRLIASRKSEELFMLNLLLMTLGLSWLTEHFGLSLALGAFIAGMLISETEFKNRVEAEIKPFYDLLLGLFFITIGMLLDWRIVVQQWQLVLSLTFTTMVLKLLWVSVITKLMGASAGTSLRTGIYLAQMGEFGFVLVTLALSHQLIPAHLISPILAAIVLSMLVTPFTLLYSNPFVRRIVANDWMTQSIQMTGILKKSMARDQHVIICGFGRSGQNMARLLTSEGIPYLALDTDPDIVRLASAAGEQVVYGDASKTQTLIAAGLNKAKTVAITSLNSKVSLKILQAIREKNKHIDVVVRTRDDHDIESLYHAGATEIVPEAIEGSLMLTSQVLALQGIPIRKVLRTIQMQRDARYALLRGFFHGKDTDDYEDFEDEHLLNITIVEGSFAIKQSLHNLALHSLNVRVVVLRHRDGRAVSMPDAQTAIELGDTLLLSGKPEALELAQERIINGR